MKWHYRRAMSAPKSPTFLYALASAYFALGVASLAVVGLLEPMVRGLGVTRGQIAFLVTFFALAYGVLAPGMQMIVGHLDRRRLILIGLLIIALGCALAALSTSYVWVSIARVLMALGAALVGPMVSAAAANLVEPQIRGKALGTAFSGLTLATVFGIPVTTLLGDLIGWRWSMALVGAVALVSAIWVATSLPASGGGRRVSASDLVAVLIDRMLLPAIGITFFQMTAQFATYSLIAAVLIQLYGIAPAWLAPALFLYGTGGVIGNIVATSLVDRLGYNRMIFISLGSLSIVFAVLSVLDPGPVFGVAAMFVWSFFGLMLFAPQQMRLVSIAPDQQNLLLALNSSAIYLGMAAGAAISGIAYEASGPEVLAPLSFVISLLAIASFLTSRRFERRRHQ
ncbi:MAG: MFS transporter [Ahrensia sp.]|nr:MFS transporter [Ahrensia sp.]